MPFFKVSFVIMTALLFTACSTVVTGTTQNIEVITPYAPGATCTLKSRKGQWVIPSTPGSVRVKKDRRPMSISCVKNGYQAERVKAHSHFSKAMLGNVIVGGMIGSAIDKQSGAARNYPSTVLVWLQPSTFSSSQSREMWFAEKAKYEEFDNKEQDKKRPRKIIR